MALEDLTGTSKYINSLVITNPDGATDPKSEGDNHIRGIKNTIKNTFPNITGAVTPTQSEMNVLDGITAATADLNQMTGKTIGNASGNVPISNGTLCTNLNADKVDGYDVGNSVSQVPVSNGALCSSLNADKVDGKNLNQISPMASSTEPAASTSFDVTSSIGAAWESVGPTGSGATNTWTALDSVPSDVVWIEVLVSNQSKNTAGSEAKQAIYARATGSSASIDNATYISEAYISVGGATSVSARNQSTARIPVSSRKFDLYRVTIGNLFVGALALAGWGY